MGSGRRLWVLLANAFDPTLLHNQVAYGLGKAVGLASTPECETIDLHYDGEHRGTHLLSEKAEVGTGRVEIDGIENPAADPRDIGAHATARGRNNYGHEHSCVTGVRQPGNTSGGYLPELDNARYYTERSWFKTSLGYLVPESPEDASSDEVRYMSEKMQEAINNCGGSNAGAHWDVGSFARVFLVEEFAKNPDFVRFSSTHFYEEKDRGLIYSGPPWDFDTAFGMDNENRTYEDPRGLTSTHSYPWLNSSDRVGNVGVRANRPDW